MKSRELPKGIFVHLRRNPEISHVFDVDLENINELKAYDSLECHVVLYPFSRRITSKDIAFNPFQEYIRDISTLRRSEYSLRTDTGSYLFGFFLVLIIASLVSIFKPWALLSIEAIAAFFGVYIVGKQLWKDIEIMLFNVTKDRKICYLERYYRYQLERNTTLTRYSELAKEKRYGKASLLPDKIDYIPKSNSLTLRMYFSHVTLDSFDDSNAHILSIHIDPKLEQEFDEKGFMFGVKLGLNGHRFLGKRSCELFQSISKDSIGCLNMKGEWVENASYHRDVALLGRLRFYRDERIMEKRSILAID